MTIGKAVFVKSSKEIKQLPKPDKPEYAFIGRSNVGKSSLINMLCNNNKLAQTSAKPGKTKLINHFLINDNWYLVDLPGFGYASVSKSSRAEFEGMISDYFTKRKSLVCTFLLIDSRHEPMEADLRFMEWLGVSQIPFTIIFTKADKLGKTHLQRAISIYKKILLEGWEELPPIVVSSSESRQGREEILNSIESQLP